MDNWTRQQISNERAMQDEARVQAQQERARVLARLAMEEEAQRVQDAMEAKRRADDNLRRHQNMERGYRNNW